MAAAEPSGAEPARLPTVNALLLIESMPRRAQDDFKLLARSLTAGFCVSEPIATAQHPRNGGQLLGIHFRIFPTPRAAASSRGATPQAEPPPPAAPLLECVDVLITIRPMPRRRSDEFTLSARCLTQGFEFDHVGVIGQYAVNGGQSLTIALRVCPESPPPVPPPPEKGRWGDGWPESAEAFSRTIAETRIGLSLSKAALAKLAGITEITLRGIERGGLPSPKNRASLIQALSRAMKNQE